MGYKETLKPFKLCSIGHFRGSLKDPKKGRQQRLGSGSSGENEDSILDAVFVIACSCLERLSEVEFRGTGSTNWLEEMSIIQVNIQATA